MSRIWRLLRESLAVGADFAQVGAFFGLTVGAIATVGIWLVGRLTEIGWFWILVWSPIAAAGVLVVIDQLIKLRRPGSGYDVSQWVSHPAYSVWVAACLWANCRPWPHIPADSPAYPALQMIKGAIQVGQIGILSGSGNMESRVTREELLRLASIRNERPKFLFPGG